MPSLDASVSRVVGPSDISWSSKQQQNLDPEEGEEQEHEKYEDTAQEVLEPSVRHVSCQFAGDAVQADAQLVSQVGGEY